MDRKEFIIGFLAGFIFGVMVTGAITLTFLESRVDKLEQFPFEEMQSWTEDMNRQMDEIDDSVKAWAKSAHGVGFELDKFIELLRHEGIDLLQVGDERRLWEAQEIVRISKELE